MFGTVNRNNNVEFKCIVKVKTSIFITGGKLRTTKDVYTLKRKSEHDLLGEELNSFGEDLIINNLHTVEDGEYELTTCNHEYDCESGILDGYELTLIDIA